MVSEVKTKHGNYSVSLRSSSYDLAFVVRVPKEKLEAARNRLPTLDAYEGCFIWDGTNIHKYLVDGVLLAIPSRDGEVWRAIGNTKKDISRVLKGLGLPKPPREYFSRDLQISTK